MRHRERLWLAGAAVFILIGLAYRPEPVSPIRAQYGALTHGEVLSRAQDLAVLIAPGRPDLRIQISHTGPDARLPRWEAIASDAQGRDVVSLSWDASTRELTTAGYVAAAADRSPATALTEKEATMAAWGWLRDLGMVRGEHLWRVARPARHVNTTWSVVWRADTARVHIAVDDSSGRLVQAMRFGARDA